MVSDEDLELVHTPEYLSSTVSSSLQMARVTEVPFLAFIPMCIGRPRLIEPVKLATEGTILATQLALEHGWAINLSGGYHHAKAGNGEGFCFYADVAIALRKLMNLQGDGSVNPSAPTPPRIQRPLIVDLDAHQGNGYLSLFTRKKRAELGNGKIELEYEKHPTIRIFDIYNKDIYPRDRFAAQFIDYHHPIKSETSDSQYLSRLQKHLPKALEESQPDLVVYNAGTDIYQYDPLGALDVSEQGIIDRDEFVFLECRRRNIPIAMVLSGGYTSESAGIIAKSIQNLIDKKIISVPNHESNQK